MDDEFAALKAQLQERVGQVIADRYRIDALLGVGGMGAVFKAFHLGLRRAVAVKVLHPTLARDAQISARFDREAQSASRLEHPNCVQVTDYGTIPDGTKYLVMQYLEGQELAQTLDGEGALGVDRALALMLQILHGLAHAHRQGVAHRDLKPENVFVTRDHTGAETLKLVDFGISKITSGPGAENLTRAGLVFGTPEYMSPEQALGQPSDHRADIYAAGILFYRMLTGRLPFASDDPVSLIRMQVTLSLPDLPPEVPGWLVDVVQGMTAKSVSDRIATTDEVIAALERRGSLVDGSAATMAAIESASLPAITPVVEAPAARARTRPRAWMIAAIAAVVFFGGWLALRSSGTEQREGAPEVARSGGQAEAAPAAVAGVEKTPAAVEPAGDATRDSDTEPAASDTGSAAAPTPKPAPKPVRKKKPAAKKKPPAKKKPVRNCDGPDAIFRRECWR